MNTNYIAYYRVSTKRQGESGLGLEAQQAAVREQIKGRLLASYQEIETGKDNDRPELAKAIAHARRSKATLVVAKLDRMSRNAALILALQDSGLPLLFCNIPGADETCIGIMAVIAQAEGKAISERTKAALAAYKARGGLLGAHHPAYKAMSPETRRRAQKAGSAANEAAADEAYADLLPVMREWREFGVSLKGIAERLNQLGHTTRSGKPWRKQQVSRVSHLFA